MKKSILAATLALVLSTSAFAVDFGYDFKVDIETSPSKDAIKQCIIIASEKQEDAVKIYRLPVYMENDHQLIMANKKNISCFINKNQNLEAVHTSYSEKDIRVLMGKSRKELLKDSNENGYRFRRDNPVKSTSVATATNKDKQPEEVTAAITFAQKHISTFEYARDLTSKCKTQVKVRGRKGLQKDSCVKMFEMHPQLAPLLDEFRKLSEAAAATGYDGKPIGMMDLIQLVLYMKDITKDTAYLTLAIKQ